VSTFSVRVSFIWSVADLLLDAWIDESKTRIGYKIPFNRHFYVFKPPRPLDEIDAELKAVAGRIMTMLEGLAE
jgi:type I restriction enzyme M protein